MIINQANIEFLNTAYRGNFQRGLGSVTPMWSRFATEVPSSTAKNIYAWLGQFPKLREWVGDRVIESLREDGYEIANKSFESTVGVPRVAIEDDQWNIYGPLMENMGSSAAYFPDEELFTLLKEGFAAPCFDGQNFFDTDHPVGKPGFEASVSNSGGGAGAGWFLLDISKGLKPLIWQLRKKAEFVTKVNPQTSDNVFMRNEYAYGVDLRSGKGFGFWQLAYGSKQTLDATNLKAAYTAMTKFESNEGRLLGIKPQVLLCGPSTYFTARELLEATTLANGASNTLYKLVEVVNIPWLD
jgi:phage major head subunit gpT-like protein